MQHINSYPSVFAIGHKMIEGIFNDAVVVEEKIDGSQFSFGVIDGELSCRSKGKDIIIDAPEKMFAKAVEVAAGLAPALLPNHIYRCEYLQKPKHNTLAYERVPDKNLILFDVQIGLESYMGPGARVKEATRIGLQCVPVMHYGLVESFDMFQEFLQRTSILGGCKVEGVVVKNYRLFTGEKKIAIGKYVSEAFKEVHGKEWRKSNPTQGDILQSLIERYRTPARWQKAVQHLRDNGSLEWSPRDIGNLIKEIPADIQKECETEIKEELFNFYWPKIRRGVTAGMPEWYKEELAKSAFDGEQTP